MIFHPTTLHGAPLVEMQKRGDERGYFARSFCTDEFEAAGLESAFVQQNVSFSAQKGTLRGLHFQRGAQGEAKVIRCVRGAIFDVIVDLRRGSPSYRKWEGFELSADNNMMLYVPRGFAHGFQTLTDDVEVSYLVSNFYDQSSEDGIRYNDPLIDIKWPMAPTVITDKDKSWTDYSDQRAFV
jgi:dTDP-4-dehydrorhamnose 3,5-epimerase